MRGRTRGPVRAGDLCPDLWGTSTVGHWGALVILTFPEVVIILSLFSLLPKQLKTQQKSTNLKRTRRPAIDWERIVCKDTSEKGLLFKNIQGTLKS